MMSIDWNISFSHYLPCTWSALLAFIENVILEPIST